GPPVKKEPTLSSVVIPQVKLILEYLLLRIPYLKNREHDESEEEEEVAKDKDTEATSHDLKKHVRNMEIELREDLKEISTKLETFTSTISSLSSQVAELKNIKWEIPADFLAFPSQVSSVQEKLKILDSLPCLLPKG
ncbi:hypothetical protein Tco_0019447, partial [Tanacetum coccineum]